jgi:tellurite methyltransferase
MTTSLVDEFGRIDIYLFDLLLRGVIAPPARVLDAGCGGGRNLHYLLANGFDVWAVDRDPAAVERVRKLAGTSGAPATNDRIRVASIESLPFPDASFEVVLSSAVLHFADSPEHWRRQMAEMWRVLAPGGLLWARLASSIGIESLIIPLGNERYTLPDGSDRFLVSEADLVAQTDLLGGTLADRIKTTNVQGLRCMTTWVVRKAG